MEYSFSIAGAVVRIYGCDDEMFSDAGILEEFRVAGQFTDHHIECMVTDALSPAEGTLCYADSGRRVFRCEDGMLTYIGPVADACNRAHIRTYRKGNHTQIQFLRSYLGDNVTVTGLLSALESANLALSQNGFLLHGSCIQYHNKAIVFTAPSGTGKSTQADLWCVHRNAEIINGDRIMIQSLANSWVAAGIPFCGTSGICKNKRLPLAGIICLKQSPKTQIRLLRGADAFRQIWSGCTVPVWDRQDVEICSRLLQELLSEIPVYLLECRPDISAVEAVESTAMLQAIAAF